jgi:hypothetical protein
MSAFNQPSQRSGSSDAPVNLYPSRDPNRAGLMDGQGGDNN